MISNYNYNSNRNSTNKLTLNGKDNAPGRAARILLDFSAPLLYTVSS